MKPALPDPTTGVVKRCIGPNEEGVLSLISQALFGEDQPNSVPLKVNIKLTEKAILDACKSTVSLLVYYCFISLTELAAKTCPIAALGPENVRARLEWLPIA